MYPPKIDIIPDLSFVGLCITTLSPSLFNVLFVSKVLVVVSLPIVLSTN